MEHASECSKPTVTYISILDVSDDSMSTEGNAQNAAPQPSPQPHTNKQSVYRNHKKRKVQDQDGIDKHFLLELKSCNDMISGQEEPSDSDSLFCKSLIKRMNELTPEQNMLARIRIQYILFEIKFDKTL